MRRKIETEERDNTTRASFVCTHCRKTYTDLEADQLCDLTTGEFKCNFCGDIVEEELSGQQKADSRLVLAKFNEQIEPLYLLLKEVEDLKLSPELLEPEPIDIVLPTSVRTEIDDPNKQWNSLDRNRSITNAYENMFLKENSLTVKIEEVSDSILDSKKIKDNLTNGLNDSQPKKERPAWLVESTIYDDSNDEKHLNSNKLNGINGLTNGITTIKTEDKDNSILNYFQSNGINIEGDQIKDSLAKEILDALLIYEKPDENNSFKNNHHLTNGSLNHFGNDFNSSNKLAFNNHSSNYNHLNGHYSINSTNQQNDSDIENYEFFRFPMCHLNGKLIPINKVNEDNIKLMSQSEREEFIKLSSEIYHLIYD